MVLPSCFLRNKLRQSSLNEFISEMLGSFGFDVIMASGTLPAYAEEVFFKYLGGPYLRG